MIGKLVLGTTKDSSIPVILKETGPELYVEKVVDNNGYLKAGGVEMIKIPSNATKIATGTLAYAYYGAGNALQTQVPDLSNITEIQNNGLHNAFYNCTGLISTKIDLSSLSTIGGYGCYYAYGLCTNITGDVDLSSLSSIGEYGCYYMFSNCSRLNGNVDMSSLQTISSQYSCNSMFISTNITSADLSSLVTITGNYACTNLFRNCASLTEIDISNLTNNYNSSYMFYGCTSLQSLDLSSLQRGTLNNICNRCTSLTTADLSSFNDPIETSSYAFYGCTNLVDINLDSLTFLDSYTWQYSFYNCTSLINNPLSKAECICDCGSGFFNTFTNCTNLVNGDFTNLIEVTNTSGNTFSYTFYNCTSLTTVNFPSLIRINGGSEFTNTFSGCTSLTDVYFPMFTINRGSSVFASTSFPNTATVHFRKDMQSTIESMSYYGTCFGAGSVVFDQIGTITVNDVEYERFGRFNENGYIAWHKKTSNFTTQGGITYYYLPSQISRSSQYNHISYSWSSNGGSSYIYTVKIDPQIGDYICSSWDVSPSTNPNDQIIAIDNVFIYTSDSAEPDVGDTAYSDISGTVLGTISAVA